MRQNPTPGGSIIATSSCSGIHPIGSLPEYCGAKAAVIAFCIATAPVLYAKENITFNVICPGAVATPNIPPPMREAFGEKMTRMEAVTRGYEKYLGDATVREGRSNGEICEVSVDKLLLQPRQSWGNGEASKMTGTIYEPLFVAIHGEGSGVAGVTGGENQERRTGKGVDSVK